MRFLALGLILLAIPLAAGCGSDDDEGGGEATAGAIKVSATDFAFDPKDLQADAGEVTIELTNDGESPHAIEVEGSGVEEESETIQPGDSTTLTVELEEGDYEIYCPVGDHRDRGMVGTLRVGGGSAGGGATTEETETGVTDETATEDTETGETETGETDTSSGGGGGY